MLELSEEQKKELEKKHYGIVGKHSAVQICDWTKRSLRGEDECYKHWFYGVETFSCAQMSPVALWCDQNCIFCWRPAEVMLKKMITKEEVEDPEKIIEGILKEKRKLLIGFKGYKGVVKEKLNAALNEFPSHWAISLSGEPTLYPKLCELIKMLKEKGAKSIFLVTNGQNPEVIEKLKEEDCLPTQLYVSLEAYDPISYQKINRGIRKDAWQRLLKSLRILRDLPTRTVVRLTLIKGYNTEEEQLKKLAEIIEEAQPDFLEVKAYMWIGYSRKRLKKENMPTHEEIKQYCKILEKYLPSFEYMDEKKESRIVVYINNGKNRKKPKPERWIIKPEDWRFKDEKKKS